MSTVYASLCCNFDRWGSDSQELLDGSAKVFAGAEVAVDGVHTALLTAPQHDNTTLIGLQLLMRAFSIYAWRLLADHLHGSKHHHMSTDTRVVTHSVTTTNLTIGMLLCPARLTEERKAECLASGSRSCVVNKFSTNSTSEWLANQTHEQQKQLFASAMSGDVSHKSLYRQRRKEIRQFQQQQTEGDGTAGERGQQPAREAEGQYEDRQDDLWTTADTVTTQLASLPTVSAKVAALKTQIRFRRIVLNQDADKHAFRWSSAGRAETNIKLEYSNVLDV
eukprot:scpid73032/ scgid13743/ 